MTGGDAGSPATAGSGAGAPAPSGGAAGSPAEAAVTLRPPAAVLELARRLVDAGHETWCVGGAVRDALLGEAHLDWDLATAARPEEVRRLFRRTVPIGIAFGTVGVLDRDGRMHEVTTFRRDVRTDGRHAEVEFGVSLDDDLARRDFTINAIAWDPIGRRLHDPFGGRADLAAGLVRAVGEPAARMREDRLRALRAIRFAARFGFDIEPATWRAIADSAPHLGRLSPERVKQELDKTMEQVRRPSGALARWQSCGAFRTLVPALEEMPERSRLAPDALRRPGLAGRPARRLLRHAAVFAAVPDRQLSGTLKGLRFSNQESAAILALVARWQELAAPIGGALMAGPLDARQVRRWAARIGRLRIGGFVRLAASQWWAAGRLGEPAPTAAAVRALLRALVRAAREAPLEIADLAVDGQDLRHAGVPRGPAMGATFHALLEAVLDDPAVNTRERLLARVAERLAAVAQGAPATDVPGAAGISGQSGHTGA